MTYHLTETPLGTMIVHSASGGVIVPDGNEAYLEYLAWAEIHGEATFPPPTQEQIDALRHAEYVKPGGADSLYMKWQAGEATQEEWLAERERVRLLYPDPDAADDLA